MSGKGSIEKIKRAARRSVLRTFPPCSEVVRIISASIDRPLSVRERFLMKMHLTACKPCVRYLDQSSFVVRALRLMTDEEKVQLFSGSLREETRARIKKMLRSGVMNFL